MGAERTTGALAIANHHNYPSRTRLISNSGGNTPGISREYFFRTPWNLGTQVQPAAQVAAQITTRSG